MFLAPVTTRSAVFVFGGRTDEEEHLTPRRLSVSLLSVHQAAGDKEHVPILQSFGERRLRRGENFI